MQELVTYGTRAWGRFDERPVYLNPLDAYGGLGKRLRRFRLKEWVGWTFMHPELSASMILQDANYLASSEIYVRDAASQRLTQHSATAAGGSLKLPEALYGSSPSLRRPGYEVGYVFGPRGGTHEIHVDIAAGRRHGHEELPIRADLTLDGSRASAPLSVSQPLRPRGAMYTHKLVFPVSGTLAVGEHTYDFDASRDLVILDEHKSFLPYRTRWLWGTFATVEADGIVAANFCQRPDVAGTPGESCLWVPGSGGAPVCIGVDPVRFERDSDDPLAAWHATSADGRLDVTFTPDGRKDVSHQLVVFGIDYWQLYGTWSGTVGERRVQGVRGVMENMDARL